MTPCGKMPKLSPSVFAVLIAFSLGLCAGTLRAHAGQTIVTGSIGDFISDSDSSSTRPLATFFTINEVLAKLDRRRGNGLGALRVASLTRSNPATDAQPAQKEAPAVGTEPFGLFTFRAPEGVLWRKWRDIEFDVTKEHAVLDRCQEGAEGCPSYAAQFLRLIKAVKAKVGRDRLDEANRAVNMAIRYVSDYAQHGEADRWSAPLATFATGKGDCEDYAIAKYVALTEAGFPRDDLKLVLVRDHAVRQDHAVLAARLDSHWLILDSRYSDLMDDSEASSFTPLFAMNYRGVQLFAAPYVTRVPLNSDVDAVPAASSEGDVGE